MAIIEISYLGLFLCLLFVLLAALISHRFKLELEGEIIEATIRCYLQLWLMGLCLHYLFEINSWPPLLAVYTFMVFFAATNIRRRVKEKGINYFWPVFLAMLSTYILITAFVLGVIIGVRPWYSPIYFIPIGGMIIGNSMNAITIAIDRLLSELRLDRHGVEMEICLGASYQEATARHFKRAISAGMVPSINAMMGVGMVFIPGMMTGQILAGADPKTAISYQIMIMTMLVAVTAIGSIGVVYIVRYLCFDNRDRLRF